MTDYIGIIKNEFSKRNILVMGDMMVDEYVTGKVKRISPEAPVPVLNYSETRRSAGGASNVVRNLRTLGANVWAVGIAAEDNAGMWLRENFEELNVNVDGMAVEPSRPTIVKTRYATKGQQLLRVDNEVCGDISESTKKQLLSFLEANVDKLDAVVLSDYCKGIFEDGDFVRAIIKLCNQSGVFISIDSKSKNIACFAGADFVKPNNLELEAAVGVQITDEASLEAAGRIYLEKSGINALVVTRGSKGISIFENNRARRDFAATEEIQVFDVTGAGDTVISTITIARVSGMDMDDAIKLANVAAGIVISKVGTVAIEQSELVEKLNER